MIDFAFLPPNLGKVVGTYKWYFLILQVLFEWWRHLNTNWYNQLFYSEAVGIKQCFSTHALVYSCACVACTNAATHSLMCACVLRGCEDTKALLICMHISLSVCLSVCWVESFIHVFWDEFLVVYLRLKIEILISNYYVCQNLLAP